MDKAQILRIFLASPSDVKVERELIFALKDDLDHLIGKPNQIRFEFVNWERNAYPGIGDDAQDVINNNIKDEFDVFIGIFWQRFGTPTNRAESGTEEEFDRALEKYNQDPNSTHIMLYFKTAPPNNIYDLDYSQFEKVKQFKKEIQSLGVLYWEFNQSDDLKNQLLLHLASLVRDKFSGQPKSENQNKSLIEPELDKYELLALEVEKESEEVSIEGILQLVESTSDSMNKLPPISENISSTITFIGSKFTEKTKQMNAIKNIRDNRLKLKKATQIANSLSVDLNKYSDDMNGLVPEFKSELNLMIESYTKLIMSASTNSLFAQEAESQLKDVIPNLYNTVDNVLVNIADFLSSFSTIPAITSKFGNSKRKAELATNELFKEFISAKKLMKQLIE